jgi:hypothetical protein
MACAKCTVMDIDGVCPHELKRAMTTKKRKSGPSAMDTLVAELERLKARCKMLRKLRDIRIIVVREPNGQVVGIYSVPTSSMEKDMLKMDELIGRMRREFNQDVSIEVPVLCDSMIGLEMELAQLNQTDDGTDLTP